MKQNTHSLDGVLNSLRQNGALAITGNNQLAEQGTILLTVYSDDEHTIEEGLIEIDTVTINGLPAQVELEQSHYETLAYEDTLVYLREDTKTILEDDSEISEKPIEEGLEDLQHHFLDFADECACEEKRTALNSTGDDADTTLLKQCADSQNPQDVFEAPYGDTVIEVYTIGRHEYALYFDGGVYEAYKCSTTASLTMSEQLRDSDFWQRNPPQESRISPAV
jgi:hypothetical protein